MENIQNNSTETTTVTAGVIQNDAMGILLDRPVRSDESPENVNTVEGSDIEHEKTRPGTVQNRLAVNQETGIAYRDGYRYASASTIADMVLTETGIKISRKTIEAKKNTIKHEKGISLNTTPSELYCLEDIEELLLTERRDKLIVNQETGIAERDGFSYALPRLAAELITNRTGIKVEANWVKHRKEKVKSIDGLGLQNATGTLYCVEDLAELLRSERGDKLIVNQDTGVAQRDGLEYAAIETSVLLVSEKTKEKVSSGWLTARTEKVRHEKGIGRNGKDAELYCLEDIEELIKAERGNKLVANPETGIAERDGLQYASPETAAKWISEKTGIIIGSTWVRLRQNQVKSEEGIMPGSKSPIFYCLEDLEGLAVAERGNKLVANPETGIAERDGLQYASPETAAKWISEKTGVLVGQNWVRARRDKVRSEEGIKATGNSPIFYCLEDLEKLLRNEKAYGAQSINDFGNFTTENDVQECYKLFGTLSHSDILILFGKEEFKEIPSDKISRIISENLGDTLMDGVPLSDLVKYKDIFKRIDELDTEVQTRMANYLISTVVGNGIIDLYSRNHGRYEEPSHFRDEIFAYLDKLTEEIDSKFLTSAFQKYKADFSEMMNFQRPTNMVESVNGSRHFPDFYQLINVHEIETKQRMLIADQMGMGKSASAILAKESLTENGRCGCALVVVPSNILENDTWQTYLSDQVDEDGRQLGYFREGEAPRVLVVENPGDLKDELIVENYDYVLVSQEKLNSSYMPFLEKLDFDMLISDEVHKLKKVNGVLSKNLITLGEKFTTEDKYMVLLSGTPIPNKVHDIAVALKLLRSDVPDIKRASIQELSSKIIEGSGDMVGMSEIRGYLMSHMQMKRMTKEIVGHKAEETEIVSDLGPEEQELFELIREDDELTSAQKIQLLQQLTLNPMLISPELEVRGTKTEQLKMQLEKRFEQGAEKIIIFVNQYITGVIRDSAETGSNTGKGEIKNIVEQLDLADNFSATVHTIHGQISGPDRKAIQDVINSGTKRSVVFVGGQTADVGIDFSGAYGVIFYNRPWSNYDKSQQAGRVYRPGLKHDIFIDTLTTGPFEKGMAEYVDSKEKVIEKMLRGIPLSELERDLIRTDEVRVSDEVDLSDISLGEIKQLDEYLSAPQKLNRYLATAKRIRSEEKFREVFIGSEYAKNYALCSERGYQPNNNRLASSLIMESIKADEKKPHQVAVLDLASGPRMLRRYSPEVLKSQVVSEDILEEHFQEEDIGKNAFIGSFKETKWPPRTFEYVTFLEALHQAGYVPRKGNFERLEVLAEINRVLEPGGKAFINIIYSLNLKDKKAFEGVIGELGFRIVVEQSGQYSSGDNFETTLLVLEKVRDLPSINYGDEERPKYRLDIKQIVEAIRSKGLTDGLKLEVSKKILRNTNVILEEVELPNGKRLVLDLNEHDRTVKTIREKLSDEAKKLTVAYTGIESIPGRVLSESHFKRCKLGSKYVLYHRLPGDAGFFTYRK